MFNLDIHWQWCFSTVASLIGCLLFGNHFLYALYEKNGCLVNFYAIFLCFEIFLFALSLYGFLGGNNFGFGAL